MQEGISLRLLRALFNWLLSKKEADIFSVDSKAPKPSDYPRYEISWSELVTNLEELGLELMLKKKFKPDHIVSYTDEASWAKIVPYLVFPADLYVANVADCDDYAKAASAKAALKFKLNGCRECYGNTPDGRHAFGLLIVGPKKYRLLESNAGFEFAGQLLTNTVDSYVAKSWK